MKNIGKAIVKFLKQLLCAHYWDEGVPLDPARRFQQCEFTCVRCGQRKVRNWNWYILENIRNRRD